MTLDRGLSQMRCEAYKMRPRLVSKRATTGERIMGALLPARGMGWPGGWSQNRLQQIQHFTNWSYVAIHCIARNLAKHMPNMAYVHPGQAKSTQVFKSYYGNNDPLIQNPIVLKDTNRIREYGTDSLRLQEKELQYVNSYKRKALTPTKPHEELEPLEYDHPLMRLIENPNPMDTMFDLLYELDMFMELTGIAYLWAVPNGFGIPCELWVIPSHWVWPRSGGGALVSQNDPHAEELIDYYEIRPWGGMGSAGLLKFPPNEVVSFPWKNPLNKLDGYAASSACSMWIDSEESITRSRWAHFINQARPELHIELGPGYEDPNSDKIARIEAMFAAKYQGELNSGRPIISPPGSKITPLSFKPEEMGYIGSEDQISKMILSSYSVPGAAVGLIENLTFGSILAVLAALCQFTLNPRFTMLGQRMTKFLAPKFKQGSDSPIRMWWDDTTPPDPAQVNADIQLDVQNQALSPNEHRAIRGRAPWKNGGDDPMIDGPGGKVPLPLNTGEDLTELADLIPILPKVSEHGEEGLELLEGQEDMDSAPKGELSPPKTDMNPNIREPNSKPTKQLEYVPQWMEKAIQRLEVVAKKFDSVEKTAGPHKFSSTQFNVIDGGYSRTQGGVIDKLSEMLFRIEENDLAGDGRETTFHATCFYGLHTQDAKVVENLVKGFGGVTIKFGKTSIFTNEEKGYDVVKVDIESHDLEGLHNLIGDYLENTNNFPEFLPHLTLAYVAIGKGSKYVGMDDVEGMELSFDKLTFSPKEGLPVSIDLSRQSKRLKSVKKDGGWITLHGGGDEEGGTHVYIDDSGRITAGPQSLEGQNIHRLPKKPFPADLANKPKPEASKPTPKPKPKPPKVTPSNGQSEQPLQKPEESNREEQSKPIEKPKKVPAKIEQVNSKIDKFSNHLRKTGNHEVAEWLDKLKEHVNSVGVESALESLGDEKEGGDSSTIQYQGSSMDISDFAKDYLSRTGISILPTYAGIRHAKRGQRVISSASPSQGKFVRDKNGDIFPKDPTLRDKLQESKSLPGLEKSEDINVVMGVPDKKVTHLTPDVMTKLDETYGKGQWIVKTYDDNAFAGNGIFFPQRSAQIKQDAQNTLWNAGSNLDKYGFKLRRNEDGQVVGLEHKGGDKYDFGTEKYENTIKGDARHWGDKAADAAPNEKGAQLPRNEDGSIWSMMAQPAFAAVGVSDADRAAGKTIAPGEGRVHITTKNGKVEVIPHSTWIKGEHLPVVFESEETKAMAKAAQDAINALPESERNGQIYAPDIIKTADGYKVVEANPANETGTSGYLNDNPLIIDSYVSHLVGRSPAHVSFIRNLLTKKGKK